MWVRVAGAFLAMDLAVLAVGAVGAGLLTLLTGEPVSLSGVFSMAVISLFLSLPLALGATLFYWVPVAIIFHRKQVRERWPFALAGAGVGLFFVLVYSLGRPDLRQDFATFESGLAMTVFLLTLLCAGLVGGLVYRRVLFAGASKGLKSARGS